MISERFPVGAGADRMAAIHTITQNFAWQNWLDKKNALRLMLLVEETIGMMNAMVEDYRGEMWLSYEDRICRINLEVAAPIDKETERQLLSVSTSGRNISKGFMAMIGKMITDLVTQIGNAPYTDVPDLYDVAPIWTLETYKATLAEQPNDEAWDELEKSIVARLADDVIVGIKDDHVRMIIVKKIEEPSDDRNMSVAETMLVDNLWARVRLAH